MITVLKEAPKTFASEFGKGVNKGLNALVERKINELNKSRENEKLKEVSKKSGLNLPEWFFELPEDNQKEFWSQLELVPDDQRQQIQAALDNVGLDEDQLRAEQEDEMDDVVTSPEGNLYPPIDVARHKEQQKSTLPGVNSLMQAGNGFTPGQTPAQGVQSFPERGHGTQGQSGPIESSAPTYRFQRKAASSRGAGSGEPTEYQKQRLDLENKKAEGLQERFTHKETKKYVDSIYDIEKAKHEEDNILKRIIHVTENDDVRNPVLSQLMQQIGINYEGLKNGETVEMEKLSNWFLRGGTKLFGGKVSNNEMNVLLRSVPNALQTNEGRIRLSKQMLLANKDYHDEFKTLHKIEDENDGHAPLNIRHLVETKMAPIREKNAKRFIEGIYDEEKDAAISRSLNPKSYAVGQKINPNTDPRDLPEGFLITNKKTGKRKIVKNGKWEEVG